jgi:hypothetical protein
MNSADETFQEEIDELIDYAVYLHLMGSFVPWVDFGKVKNVVTEVYDFIKTESEENIKCKLPELQETLKNMASLFMTKFPLKRELCIVNAEFNFFFKSGDDIYTYGLQFGWLDAQMDLSELKLHI